MQVMSTCYLANGLAVSCTFTLPGMIPRDAPGMPTLTLRRATDTQLRAAWGAPDGPPRWKGRLGDGQDLTLQRGTHGELLFSYGQRAQFLLLSTRRSLSCAPRAEGLQWQRALLSKVLPIVSVIRGYEALHASAVDTPDGVIAILAPSGAGKTTLAVELMRRGRPLISDDILTLGATPGGVLAHGGTPHMNLPESHPDASAERLGSTLGILAGERWLAARAHTARPRPVRTICLLQRGPALSLDAHPLPANPLAFAPYMLGLPDDYARQRRRFALYSDLASSAAILRITCGPGHDAGDLADLIEGQLDTPAPRVAVDGRA